MTILPPLAVRKIIKCSRKAFNILAMGIFSSVRLLYCAVSEKNYRFLSAFQFAVMFSCQEVSVRKAPLKSRESLLFVCSLSVQLFLTAHLLKSAPNFSLQPQKVPLYHRKTILDTCFDIRKSSEILSLSLKPFAIHTEAKVVLNPQDISLLLSACFLPCRTLC